MERPIIHRENQKTSISFFTPDERASESVRNELEEIFKNKHMDDWKSIIYTCVKELMVNASKSNIKRTFFIEAKINEKDREIYRLAKTKVKKIMTDEYFSYLREKLKKHGHNVEVTMEDKNNGIVLSVKNPLPLLEDEEAAIRKNLKLAMENQMTDLALFYSDDDDSEGASLGLLLVVNLLRQMNVNPALFRVGIIDGKTIARIEIPLANNYNSVRDL